MAIVDLLTIKLLVPHGYLMSCPRSMYPGPALNLDSKTMLLQAITLYSPKTRQHLIRRLDWRLLIELLWHILLGTFIVILVANDNIFYVKTLPSRTSFAVITY